MRVKTTLPLLLFMMWTTHIYAQNVQVDYSPCREIYTFLKNLKDGQSLEEAEHVLDIIIKSAPYRTMFRHYNRSWRPNHLPEPVFKNMILSVRWPDKYTKGENRRADQMWPHWKKAYTNLETYERDLVQLESRDLQVEIQEAVAFAQSWLPPSMTIPDSYLIILPHGGSGAFVMPPSQGHDFFQLAREDAGSFHLQTLAEIIAHEAHHLGLDIPYPAGMTPTDSLVFRFLTVFIGEGTATKFINNVPGGWVPRIGQLQDTPIADASRNPITRDLWHQYIENEESIFNRMCQTVQALSNHKMDKAALNQDLRDYWMTGAVGRNYFLGSEFFGAIYFGMGKKGCFQAMEDPRRMFELYNQAIRNDDRLKPCIPVPDDIVELARDLGH